MKISSSIYYYFIGVCCLFMNKLAYASALPLADKLVNQAEKEGFFTFFRNFMKESFGIVFDGLSMACFFVWALGIIYFLYDWKQGKSDTGELIVRGLVMSGVCVVVFVILVSATATAAA